MAISNAFVKLCHKVLWSYGRRGDSGTFTNELPVMGEGKEIAHMAKASG